MFIHRDLISRIQPWLGTNKILIIKGARQVGKTTLLNEIKKELEARGEHILDYSVDQELDNPIFRESRLFRYFLKDQISEKRLYVFLDEFQYIPEAGLFLKTIVDAFKDQVQLIVSGSSSLEITRNSEYLTGRKLDFLMRPLSFREFVRFKAKTIPSRDFSVQDWDDLKDFHAVYGQDLKLQFFDYIRFGGYPEIVLASDKSKKEVLLKELLSTYIQKDVAGFLKIENISGFNNLIRILFSQIGNLVNKNELNQTLGLNYETISRYLDILEGTYVVDYLKPFFTNVRKELTKMPKVYVSDLGYLSLYSDIGRQIQDNLLEGGLVENFIYNELSSRYGKDMIRFYRTISKAEIDFVFLNKSKISIIESKYKRKVKASPPVIFNNFVENYPETEHRLIITQHELFYDPDNKLLLLPVYLLPFLNLVTS